MDQVRDRIRARHGSPRTERAYCSWIRRFIVFHQKRHPRDVGREEVSRFLTTLATTGRVRALVFLYTRCLAWGSMT
jgi:hypothetical protein